jgi:hypothetical protein
LDKLQKADDVLKLVVYYENKKIYKMLQRFIYYSAFLLVFVLCGKVKRNSNNANDDVDRAAILDDLGTISFLKDILQLQLNQQIA